MISVSIEGRAGQMLGKHWRLHVGTVGEAVKALRANAGHLFHKALKASAGYVLVVDGVPVESQGCFFKKIKKGIKALSEISISAALGVQQLSGCE